MSEFDETWKNISVEIPTLLPLGPVPQQPDPGEMLLYLQGLHNYIADDRQKLVRALNVLSRFRAIQTDSKTDANALATGSGMFKTNIDTGLQYYDAITQDAVSGAVWKPVAAPRSVADFFNGSFVESFDAIVSSDGATITLSLEQTGGGDLTCRWSTGDVTLDCTPAQTVQLVAGTDTTPVDNFVYIPRSTKILTRSTDWPKEEHIKVAYVYTQSATKVQSDGPLVNQNWNDHNMGTDGQGHMTHMAERSRKMGAIWYEGVQLTVSAPGATLDFITTGGGIYQMHKQDFPAVDTTIGAKVHVANDSVTPYVESSDPETLITLDSVGGSLANKYFNIVLWGVANKGAQSHSPLMITLPSGSYSTLGQASADTAGYDNFQMPNAFSHESSTGFLIARITLQWSGGTSTLTHHGTVDLRGYNPLTASGGSGSLVGALLQDGSTPLTGNWDAGAYDITTQGNLYLDATSAPSIFLREAGASGDYSLLQDNSASLLRFRKVTSATQSIMDLEPFPSNGTSDARIRLFRSTNTTGSCDLEIYQGDGTSTQAHRFEGDTGDAYLCQQGGNVTIEEGNVYLDKTSQPTISLREGGSATDYTYLIDSASLGAFVKRAATGAATLRCDPLAIDGTSGATMQFFRTTNTTGSVDLIIYPGDGSATNTFRFEADTGNAFINSGSLYLDKTTSPTIYLREAGSTTSYGFLQNSSASTSILAHAANSGLAYLQLEARASDGTSGAFIQMNRNTNTTGVSSGVYIYKADGSSTVNYQFLSKGDCQLNKDSGNAYFYGNVYLDKTSNPSIYLRESADTTSYFLLQDQDDNTALINKYTNSGTCYLNLNPMSSGTDSSYIRMFRNVNTSGYSGLFLYLGDGSATVQHSFAIGSSGDANLCQQGGQVTIGGTAGAQSLTIVGGSILLDNNRKIDFLDSVGAQKTLVYFDASNWQQFGQTSNPTKVWGSYLKLSAASSVLADASMDNNTINFWIDQTANALKVKVKYSTGTVKNGTVATLT